MAKAQLIGIGIGIGIAIRRRKSAFVGVANLNRKRPNNDPDCDSDSGISPDYFHSIRDARRNGRAFASHAATGGGLP